MSEKGAANDPSSSVIARYLDLERPKRGEHPPTAAIIAYADQRLSWSAREDLENHLALCPSCRESVIEARRFILSDPDRDEASDPEADAGMNRMLARLRRESSAYPSSPSISHDSDRQPSPPQRWLWALAAFFAATTLSLALFRLVPEDPNATLVSLAPGNQRSIAVEEVEIGIRPWVSLILGAHGRHKGDLTLLDENGDELHQIPGLEANSDDRFVLFIQSRHFEPGSMVLRIKTDGNEEPLEYRLRVLAPKP